MAVPGVTSAPGLTWRRPSTPANGARTTRSSSVARTRATRARAASRAARWVSSAERAMSCCAASSDCRANCRSASRAFASASARSACCACPPRVMSGAPARTTSPDWKCTRWTISLTFAVTVTDSRARTVPSACTASLKLRGCSTCVVTATGRSPPPGPPGPPGPREPPRDCSGTARVQAPSSRTTAQRTEQADFHCIDAACGLITGRV